jgi:serralysin
MTTIYQTTNIDDSGNAISFTTGGNSLTIAPDVSVSSTGGTAVFITATGNAIDNSGEIYGYDGGIDDTLQSTGTGSVFTNEQSGIIVSNYWAISVQDDPYTITNYGRISTTTLESGYGAIYPISYGALANYGSISGGSDVGYFSLDNTGATTTSVVNFGSITAASVALEDDNAYDSDIYTLDNYGSIVGGQSAFQTFGNNGDAEQLTNNGTMQGVIAFGAGAGDFLQNSGLVTGNVTLGSGAGDYVSSTLGTIDGTITCGSGGDVVIAGNTGGSVVGGSGNDVLYANPTQTAANNAAKTTLDGATGNNWLYGDGAFTTFMSGDNSAGTYNQIFGGQSEMADVAGYANNTVSYADMSSAYKSVYVNLLDGDAYMCSIADANGAPTSDYTFEDYLQNVPNVIGSSGSDVIICDDGVDRITHGGGAGDVFYAGAGAGSQDTFVYTAMDESPLSNHDIVEGFKVGIDKLNFSQLDLPIADFLLSYGGAGSNTVYVEKNPSTGFNSATDMIISVQASTSAALTYKDLIA